MGELDGRKRKAAITSSSGLELLDGKGGEDLTKVDNPAQSGRPDAQPGREADAREDEGRGSSSVTVPPPTLSYEVDTPRPSPRTNRTRRVPHPVLIGHAASLSQVEFAFRSAASGLFLAPIIVSNLSANQFWSSHEVPPPPRPSY